MNLIQTGALVAALCFVLAPIVQADDIGGDVAVRGTPASVAYARIAMNAEQASYFADGEAVFELKNFAPPAGPVGVAAMQPAESVVFTTSDADWRGDWHPTPRKQFVFVLGGAIEIEVADGEIRRFAVGDIILLEDTAGKGHDTRVVSEAPALFAIVALADGA